MPNRHIVPLLALAVLLVLAAPAQAFTIDNLSSAPTSTAAGAHSDFALSFDVNNDAGDDLRNLDIDLPPGLVGNPRSAAVCPRATFEGSGTCPGDTIVGTTSVNADATLIGSITATGNVYNIAPDPGEPARLGLRLVALGGVLADPIKLESPVKLRTTSDYGITSLLRDMPRTATALGLIPIDITVTHVGLTLNSSFMTNPTSCAAAPTKL